MARALLIIVVLVLQLGAGLAHNPPRAPVHRLQAVDGHEDVDMSEVSARLGAAASDKMKLKALARTRAADYTSLNAALAGAEGFATKKNTLPGMMAAEEGLVGQLEQKIHGVDEIYKKEHDVDTRRERDSTSFLTEAKKLSQDAQKLKEAAASGNEESIEAAMTAWETDSGNAQINVEKVENDYDEARQLLETDRKLSAEADNTADTLWKEHGKEKKARRGLQSDIDKADSAIVDWSKANGFLDAGEAQERMQQREKLRVDQKTRDPVPTDEEGLSNSASPAVAGPAAATAATVTPAVSTKPVQAETPVATAKDVTPVAEAPVAETAPAEIEENEKQLYALLDIRESSPELTTKWPETYDNGAQCEFEGVVCSADKSVIEITIAGSTALKIPDMSPFSALSTFTVSDSSPTLDSMGAENLAKAAALTSLTFRACKLAKIPAELKALKELAHLDVSENGISDIPRDILSLPKLERLYLTKNLMTVLPSNIGSASALKELYVARNSLSDLPTSLGDLAELSVVDVSHNKLTALPEDLFAAKSLGQLLASHNELTTIPATVGSLAHLEELDVSFNRILSVPEGVGLLSGLKVLRVSNNKELQSLPAVLADVQLDRLSVDMESLHPQGEVTAEEATFLGAVFHNSKIPYVALTTEKTEDQIEAENAEEGCLYKGVSKFPGVTVFVCGDHEAIQLLSDPTEVVEAAECPDEQVETTNTPIAELENKEERILGVVHGDRIRCFDILELHQEWKTDDVTYGTISNEDPTKLPPNFMQRYEEMLVAYMKKHTEDPNSPRVPIRIGDAKVECKNGDDMADVDAEHVIGWRIDPAPPGTENDPQCRTDCFDVNNLKTVWASDGEGTNPLIPENKFSPEFIAMAKSMLGDDSKPEPIKVKPEVVSIPTSCTDYYPPDAEHGWEGDDAVDKIGLKEGDKLHCYTVAGLNREWTKPPAENALTYSHRPDKEAIMFDRDFMNLYMTKLGMMTEKGMLKDSDGALECETPRGCMPSCGELSAEDCSNKEGCVVKEGVCGVECGFVSTLKGGQADATIQEKTDICNELEGCYWHANACTVKDAQLNAIQKQIADMKARSAASRVSKPMLAKDAENCDMKQKSVDNFDELPKNMKIALIKNGKKICYSLQGLRDYWDEPGSEFKHDPENPDDMFPADFMDKFSVSFNYLFQTCKLRMHGRLYEECESSPGPASPSSERVGPSEPSKTPPNFMDELKARQQADKEAAMSSRVSKPMLSKDVTNCEEFYKGPNPSSADEDVPNDLRIALTRLNKNYCYSLQGLIDFYEQSPARKSEDPLQPKRTQFPFDFMDKFWLDTQDFYRKCKLKMYGAYRDGCPQAPGPASPSSERVGPSEPSKTPPNFMDELKARQQADKEAAMSSRVSKPMLSKDVTNCEEFYKGPNPSSADEDVPNDLRIALTRLNKNYCYSLQGLIDFYEQSPERKSEDPLQPKRTQFPFDFMDKYRSDTQDFYRKCKLKMYGEYRDGCPQAQQTTELQESPPTASLLPAKPSKAPSAQAAVHSDLVATLHSRKKITKPSGDVRNAVSSASKSVPAPQPVAMTPYHGRTGGAVLISSAACREGKWAGVQVLVALDDHGVKRCYSARVLMEKYMSKELEYGHRPDKPTLVFPDGFNDIMAEYHQ